MPSDYSDDEFPLIPPELLVALERRFPEKCADLKETEREIFHYSGQVHTVKFLRSMAEYQQNRGNNRG